MSTSSELACIEAIGATSDGVGSGIRPATPTIDASTAAPESCAACIEQCLFGLAGPLGWCIGHVAPTPCPQVHSSACACESAALAHNAIGANATVPTWHDSQMATSGTSLRRRHLIGTPHLSVRRIAKST